MFRNDTKLIIFNFILLEFYNLFKFIKLDHTDYFDKKTLSDRLKVIRLVKRINKMFRWPTNYTIYSYIRFSHS